ncbi:MAG: S1 RNA-binding domain-containing protein, partial [Planctomycetota bacterium]
EGIDGLLHVSDMSWTRKVAHPSEVAQKGDTLKTVVLEVDPQKRRVALGLKQLESDPWKEDIPGRYRAGDLVRGIVTKLTSFGAFVELEDGLEGLLHVSELSEKKIPSPEEIVDVGDVLDVRVIRVDTEGRKIGLSLRSEGPVAEEEEIPRIVIRSDQLEEAENPEEMVEAAMEAAPQLGRDKDAAPSAEPVESGLEIPEAAAVAEEAPAEAGEAAVEPAPSEAPEPAVEAPEEAPGAEPDVPSEAEGETAPEPVAPDETEVDLDSFQKAQREAESAEEPGTDAEAGEETAEDEGAAAGTDALLEELTHVESALDVEPDTATDEMVAAPTGPGTIVDEEAPAEQLVEPVAEEGQADPPAAEELEEPPAVPEAVEGEPHGPEADTGETEKAE